MAIIAAVPTTIASVAALYVSLETKNQTKETHNAVNGRLSDFIKKVEDGSASKATLVEKQAERVRELELEVAKAKALEAAAVKK